jgi:Cu2+-exporting ATPase
MKTENIFSLGYNPRTDRFKMDSCCSGNHSHQGGGHSHQEGGNMSGGKYQCYMKCEGDKIYQAPGKCPVCNMQLVPVDGKQHHH